MYIQLEFNFGQEAIEDTSQQTELKNIDTSVSIKTNPGKGLHNQQFDILQRDYLKTRSQKTLSKMYLIVYQMQTNYLHKWEKTHNCYFSEDDFNSKVEDATMFVIEKFLKRQTFYVNRLSAYAHFGMIKVLYDKKDEEMATQSLDYAIELEGEAFFNQINRKL